MSYGNVGKIRVRLYTGSPADGDDDDDDDDDDDKVYILISTDRNY